MSCSAFVRTFLRWGIEERERLKAIQLEKQRRLNFYRKTEHDRKMKELESKITVEILYDFSEDQEISAFSKLAKAAVKVSPIPWLVVMRSSRCVLQYDKNHPGAVSLAGFDATFITPAVFRELLKRCFNVTLTPHELGTRNVRCDRPLPLSLAQEQ